VKRSEQREALPASEACSAGQRAGFAESFFLQIMKLSNFCKFIYLFL
jgi:hypothetical protein